MSNLPAAEFSGFGQASVPVPERRQLAINRIEQPAAEAPPKPSGRSTAAAKDAADAFTGPMTNAQFKLPADLVASLKLMSIQEGRSMSTIVQDCLTTDAKVVKCWVSSRRAG